MELTKEQFELAEAVGTYKYFVEAALNGHTDFNRAQMERLNDALLTFSKYDEDYIFALVKGALAE